MAFDTVKDGLVGLLKALGYAESKEAIDFKNASPNEYGNTFILKALSGELSKETLVNRIYDIQEWQVQIAFEKSSQDDVICGEIIHRKKDTILPYLDNPANWTSFVRTCKYKSWNVLEFPNYLVLDIRLRIVDTYTY
jgi:hypothetical protein